MNAPAAFHDPKPVPPYKPIRRIEVEGCPAFIIIDDEGNEFFKELNLGEK